MVGRCHFTSKRRDSQSSAFEYADEWLRRSDAFALDPANMPLSNGWTYTSGATSSLPGALRDTAPDRWGQRLIQRAFRKSGETRLLTEIDYLLGLSDLTRIGALRFRPEGVEAFEYDIGERQVPPLLKLAQLINASQAVLSESETADELKLLLNEGSPLGGARPKSVVVDHEGHLFIAKFSKGDDEYNIPQGEVLAMKLARLAGIKVANARLLRVEGRSVSLISRFDRIGDRRIPFISAMTLLGLEDGDQATYVDIAEVIRMYSSSPTEDLRELWRRVVFNVLVGNLDDHLRNHGFVYDRDGMWRLSPAYDLNPVPFSQGVRELRTWISEIGPEADLELARSVAQHFKLDLNQADEIIVEVNSVLRRWRSLVSQLGMTSSDAATYESAFQFAD